MVIQKVMINFGDMFSTYLKHPFWSFLDQNQQENECFPLNQPIGCWENNPHKPLKPMEKYDKLVS